MVMSLVRQAAEFFSTKSVVWNLAFYTQDAPFSIDFELDEPTKLFRSRHLKCFTRFPHTRADPFLFSHEGSLFIFYEIVFPLGHGKIAAFMTKDLKHFENLGVVLCEDYHISFPYVFSDTSGDIFLLTESSKYGITWLYKFDQFPSQLRKVRGVLFGDYRDSFLVRKGEVWFMFTTTSSRSLHIFYTKDLIHGAIEPHPLNPISSDPRYSRCGGGPLFIDGRLYRVAQDCSQSYGRNIHLFEIEELSEDSYRERLVRENAIDLRPAWRRLGSHHLSVTEFLGKTVVSLDGQEPDLVINRFLALLYRRTLAPLFRLFDRSPPTGTAGTLVRRCRRR